jgi:hypothetical protein
LIIRKICVAIDPILPVFVARGRTASDDGLVYGAPDLDAFSAFDGFSSFREMVDFWSQTRAAKKFHGWQIRRLPLRQMRWT